MPRAQGKSVAAPTAAQQSRDEAAFFARLRAALHTSGMRQSELARRLGCNASTVTEWFGRGSMPKGHLMLYIPRALGVSPTWLLSGEGPLEEGATDKGANLRSAYEVLAMVEQSLEKVRKELESRESVKRLGHRDAVGASERVRAALDRRQSKQRVSQG